MDSLQHDANNEHKSMHGNDAQHLPILRNNSKLTKQSSISSSSSSSSSNTSSEEDFIQLDASELNKPATVTGETVRLASDAKAQSSKDTFSFSPDIPLSRPAMENFGVPGSMHSPPPAQTMARNDFPDPNRIPSSVFARTKSTTPMEWSVASNESLFSIHMGNSSFSRDHVFLLGRSGELTNFTGGPSDAYMPPLSPSTSGPLPPMSPVSPGKLPPMSPVSPAPLPPISPASSGFVRPMPGPVSMGQGLDQPSAAEAANAEAMKEVLRVTSQEHANNNKPSADDPPHSASISRHSDGSVTSFRSFAFPILTGDNKSESVKIGPDPQMPKPVQQPQSVTPAETPKTPPPEPPAAAPAAAAGTSWFPCFQCTFCC